MTKELNITDNFKHYNTQNKTPRRQGKLLLSLLMWQAIATHVGEPFLMIVEINSMHLQRVTAWCGL